MVCRVIIGLLIYLYINMNLLNTQQKIRQHLRQKIHEQLIFYCYVSLVWNSLLKRALVWNSELSKWIRIIILLLLGSIWVPNRSKIESWSPLGSPHVWSRKSRAPSLPRHFCIVEIKSKKLRAPTRCSGLQRALAGSQRLFFLLIGSLWAC